MRRLWWFGLMLGPGLAWASEPVHECFRSPAEAAMMQASAEEAVEKAQGFRLEGVRRDVLLGRSWAVVRSCEHPERPAVMVELLREAGGEGGVASIDGRGQSRAREMESEGSAGQGRVLAQARAEMPVLIAGAKVQVVRVEQNVRLTMLAVAERSASVGERVRLRVVREAGEGEQFVEGVVRGAGLVEIGVSR